MVTLNIHHLQPILNWPWTMNTIQKPLSGLKNILEKPHTVFDAETLDFVIHGRQNETQS
jgi:hypothetical protein